ncbi:MAG: conjugal transfer protein TraX [Treponema sp.]|jgi:hypothetical protein|nr:conjugal transfer protein TraX [Treponema sp.]
MDNENSIENPAGGSGPKWPALNGTAIKIIGIVLMTMDHIHQMFAAQGAPGWLNWFGRPVAVMFLFLCAEGFYYTRSRKRYLLLLLAGFFFMSVMNRLFSLYMFIEDINLINNIFGTLFLSAFYMGTIDLFRAGVREKRGSKILLAAGGFLLPLITGLALILALSGGNLSAVMILVFIPNLVSVEGGFALVMMGALFYLLRKYRLAQMGVVLLVSAFSWYITRNSPDRDFQWLMAAAVIPLFLYNGKRGGVLNPLANKYFFYIFYPAHIYLFYVIAWFLNR